MDENGPESNDYRLRAFGLPGDPVFALRFETYLVGTPSYNWRY